MGLKRGSLVSITQKDPLTLNLQPKGAETPDKIKKVTIIIGKDESSESVVRKVVSSYLIGYNIIQVKALKDRIKSGYRLAVKDFTRKKLVGTEILSDLPKELTLQVLLSYAELTVKDALRRMSIIASSMHRDAIVAIKNDDPQLAREIIAMDDEVDRFNLYIIRLLKVASSDSYVLRESGLKTPREVLGYRLITKSIERMADHASNIANNRLALMLTKIPEEIVSELEKISENAILIFEKAVDSLFDEDYKAADKVLEEADKTKSLEQAAIQMIIKHAVPEDVPALRLMVESIRRTAEYGADIAETVLNMTVTDEVTETALP
jgi:phosphate uptake regulator